MALFKFPPFKFRRRSATPGVTPSSPPGSVPASQPSSTPASPMPKSLTQLERELEAQQRVLQVKPYRVPSSPFKFKRLLWIAVLLGLPVAALWVINLPYPPIRRPISRVAPVLLLPSYMGIDRDYRNALSAINQAQQLIDQATSPEDLALGREQLNQAQISLDALPIWFLYDQHTYYGWYPWSFTRLGFDQARATLGRLQAKVFQEENAQSTLVAAEQTIATAKEQYRAGGDQRGAIASWQSGLDSLSQIPPQTFAGRAAQTKFNAYRREFEQTVGLAADSQASNSYIEAARQFAWQAAQASQNPPHSVVEWQQVETLWQTALSRLSQVTPEDPVGFRDAQQLSATYQRNLGEIQRRRMEEAQAVQTFQQAQNKVEQLVAISSKTDSATVASQIQSVINDLRTVPDGTTVYLEAQALLAQAKNKLAQLQL